jgi:hypothetical protein
VKDQLPDEGTKCWTLEKSSSVYEPNDTQLYEWFERKERTYKKKNKNGKASKSPWSPSGMYFRKVTHWIAIPKYPEEKGEK